jgi:Secretion system C-terminal sorting domain/Lectin C-type domain
MRKQLIIGLLPSLLFFSLSPSKATITHYNLGQVGGSGPEYILMNDDSNTYTWQEAQDYGINNLGGVLAAITSQAIQNAISDGLNNNGAGSADVWIGGKRYGSCIGPDANDGSSIQWEWVSADTWSFTNWGTGQPNNCSDQCTEIVGGTHEWNDGNCSNILSWAVFAVDVPLPVELISLEVVIAQESEFVKLLWQTTSETNNKGFYIERSIDGSNWEEIGFVKGSGNTTELQKYTYLDRLPNYGENYYRLKQVNFDRTFEYSKVISITIQNDKAISIYPNPTSGRITIEGTKSELSELKIFNLLGQDLTKYLKFDKSPRSRMLIDLSGLPKGIYHLKTKSTVNKIYKQ